MSCCAHQHPIKNITRERRNPQIYGVKKFWIFPSWERVVWSTTFIWIDLDLSTCKWFPLFFIVWILRESIIPNTASNWLVGSGRNDKFLDIHSLFTSHNWALNCNKCAPHYLEIWHLVQGMIHYVSYPFNTTTNTLGSHKIVWDL